MKVQVNCTCNNDNSVSAVNSLENNMTQFVLFRRLFFGESAK